MNPTTKPTLQQLKQFVAKKKEDIAALRARWLDELRARWQRGELLRELESLEKEEIALKEALGIAQEPAVSPNKIE